MCALEWIGTCLLPQTDFLQSINRVQDDLKTRDMERHVHAAELDRSTSCLAIGVVWA